MEFHTTSAEETGAVAEQFLDYIYKREGTQGTATVIGLSGDLGAGKTTFMKGIAQTLGLNPDEITSPTFVIEKIYALDSTPERPADMLGFKHLIHIDAYRLDSGDDLAPLGWHEALTDPNNLIFVEWPEQISDGLPLRTEMIHFKVVDHDEREIKYGYTIEQQDAETENQTYNEEGY